MSKPKRTKKNHSDRITNKTIQRTRLKINPVIFLGTQIMKRQTICEYDANLSDDEYEHIVNKSLEISIITAAALEIFLK